MEDYLKEALEIVKAQASVRTMTEDEVISMVKSLATGLQAIGEGNGAEVGLRAAGDAKGAVKEKSITCLECGKSFKILTKKHLSSHGLTPDQYRAKHDYPKRMPLVCKTLQRERRKKMKDMRLWEKRNPEA